MDLTSKSAAQLKELALKAMAAGDRATIAKLVAEAKRRAEAHKAQGTGTQALYAAIAKL